MDEPRESTLFKLPEQSEFTELALLIHMGDHVRKRMYASIEESRQLRQTIIYERAVSVRIRQDVERIKQEMAICRGISACLITPHRQ
jgi:hypothetical protein